MKNHEGEANFDPFSSLKLRATPIIVLPHPHQMKIGKFAVLCGGSGPSYNVAAEAGGWAEPPRDSDFSRRPVAGMEP